MPIQVELLHYISVDLIVKHCNKTLQVESVSIFHTT